MGQLTSALTPAMIGGIASGDNQVLANVLNQLMRSPQGATAAVATTYPGNGVPFVNTSNYIQQVVISGGTITAISLSRGGLTGETFGTYLLCPGDSVTCTSSVNPTVFNVASLI